MASECDSALMVEVVISSEPDGAPKMCMRYFLLPTSMPEDL